MPERYIESGGWSYSKDTKKKGDSGLSTLEQTARLIKDFFGESKQTNDVMTSSGWAAPEAPIARLPESADIFAKVQQVLNLKDRLAKTKRAESKGTETRKVKLKKAPTHAQKNNSLEMAPPAEAKLDTEDLQEVASQMEAATGFLASVSETDKKAYQEMVFGLADKLDKSAIMASFREEIWAPVPSKIKSAIAASPETAAMLPPPLNIVAPTVHFLVKAGLLPYDESAIIKGQEMRKEAVNLGKWASYLYEPLKVLGILVEPLLKVMNMQDQMLGDVREHLAARRKQS